MDDMNLKNNIGTPPPPPPAAAYAKPKEKFRFDIERKDRILAVLFMLLSIFGVAGGLWGGFRTVYAAVYIVFISLFTIFLFEKSVKRGIFEYLCGALSLLGSAVFIVTSNGSVKFWMFVCQFLMSVVWLSSAAGKYQEHGELGMVSSILNSFKTAFANQFSSVTQIFAEKDGKRSPLSKVLVGILCAVPVLLIVIPLLVSSDKAFEGLIDNVLGNISELFVKVILGVFITPFILSFYLCNRYMPKKELKESKFAGIDGIYLASFLSALAICYLTYLFSQLAYFFSGFLGILPKDYEFNIATYARRGFFELAAIAGINLAVIYISVLLSKKKNCRLPVGVKILCLFICLFTLLITATALSKMVFYIQSFGMTVLRITTSAFMIFLVVVFIALIIRLFTEKVRVPRVALITAACVLLILGGGSVNTFIAEYNIKAYTSGALETVDVKTIYELGDEGVPYLVLLTRAKNANIRADAIGYTEQSISKYYYTEYSYNEETYETESIKVKEKEYTGLDKWSPARARVYKVLDDYIAKNSDKYKLK